MNSYTWNWVGGSLIILLVLVSIVWSYRWGIRAIARMCQSRDMALILIIAATVGLFIPVTFPFVLSFLFFAGLRERRTVRRERGATTEEEK